MVESSLRQVGDFGKSLIDPLFHAVTLFEDILADIGMMFVGRGGYYIGCDDLCSRKWHWSQIDRKRGGE